MPPCLLGAHTIEAVGGNPCILELRGPLELPSPGGETEAQSRGATCPGVPQSLGSPHTAHGALPFSPWPLAPLGQPPIPLPYHLAHGKWDSDPRRKRTSLDEM